MTSNPFELPATTPSGTPKKLTTTAQILDFWSRKEYLHPVAVVVNAGGSITTIDHDGTKMRAGEPSGRGVRIELTFHPELDDPFVLAFQFHKGETSLELFPIDPPVSYPRTLWRD